MSWQQQLVPPGPTRRLRAHGTSWWGVDPSTKRVSVGVAEKDVPVRVHTVSFADLEGPARLDTIYRDCRTLAATVASTCPPGLVVVEQPSGTVTNPPLVYAVGCAMAGLYAGVLEETGAPARFETITSGEWKKQLLGYGGIKKPKPAEVRAGVQYEVLEWARATQGYEGTLWDEADALAIAAWARQDVQLEAP